MNAIVRYLGEIADALERLVGKGGTSKATKSQSSSSSSSSSSVNIAGSVDTTGINEKLETALVVTVEEEGEQEGETVEVRKSVYDVMGQEIAQVIHDAFHITVSETQEGQTVSVEKPVLDVIRQDLYDMRNSEALPSSSENSGSSESNNGE